MPITSIKSGKDSSLELYEESARVIAHELRNSLIPIKTFIKAIDSEMDEQEVHRLKVKELAEFALGQVESLFSFADRYLQYTRMEFPSLREVHIGDIIEEVVGQIRSNYPDHQINIIRGHLPGINLDPILMHRALHNLVMNAIESIDGKGIIQISAEYLDKGKLLIIKITDNGHGIKSGTEQKIFELGYTTRGERKGKGLGLAIVSRIISDLHKGEVKIENNVGQSGVTVTLVIPCSWNVKEVDDNGK